MSWEFITTYLPLYREAAVLTVKIGFAGIALSTLVGLVCMLIQYYRPPILRTVVGAYIEVSRNTPLLIQLFFIYYGFPKIGISTDAAACGVFGLAFLGSQDTIAPAVTKGNSTLLDWLNGEIEALGEESFFHADYEATLADTYGLDYEETLVVEGGVVSDSTENE